MQQAARILIAEDDTDVREMLHLFLAAQGFDTDSAADLTSLRTLLSERPVDLVVLDLHLPDGDGRDMLAEFARRSHRYGVIVLTGMSAAECRRDSLRGGADDYLTKPFEPRELLARIRAVLRRLPRVTHTKPQGIVPVGAVHFDREARVLLTDEGPVPLTAAEHSLLAAFVDHPGRVLSRARLAEWLMITGDEAGMRSVDTRIYRLRQKVEPSPATPRYIETVRGEGYRFTPEG